MRDGQHLQLSFIDVRKAYFNGVPRRPAHMKFSKESGFPSKMVAKLVRCAYGTKDAGRGFWKKLRRVLTEKACLKENFNLKAFYHYVDEDGHVAAVMGIIVDDTIYAIRPDHKLILDAIAAELVFGKIEERSFRFCGREIRQDEDFLSPVVRRR